MVRVLTIAATVLLLVAAGSPARAASAARADAALARALERLVDMPDGPPGVIALVQRGDALVVHAAGVADRSDGRPPAPTDHMRVASVAKAFSGAVALALVARGALGLDDTIGQWRPDLPAQWHGVTLRQLLAHTSGVPDFIEADGVGDAIGASLDVAPPPRELLAFVADDPLENPGRYHYSNSDNVIVALMIEAATAGSYEAALADEVAGPLGLGATTLPRGPGMPRPLLHGYDHDDGLVLDVSELLAAGWAWASGGVVATPADMNRFIRGYVGGALFGPAVQAEQRRFVRRGSSDPIGPGRNAAGLAVASDDGSRSATVSATLQRTQRNDGRAGPVFRALRRAELRAVCAAMAG